MLLVGSQRSEQPKNVIIRGLKNDILTGTKCKIRVKGLLLIIAIEI